MHRVVRHGRRGLRPAFAAVIASLVPAAAASAAPAKLLVFGTRPNAVVEVRKNSVLVATAPSSLLGSVVAAVEAGPGDRFDIVGTNTQPPVPPLFTSLVTSNPGCATAVWLPSGDPTVVGYVVSFGMQSVAGGQASQYEHTVEVGAASAYTACVLPSGRHYFAVRARNVDGLLSAYSAERSVVIQTVAVLIRKFDVIPTEGGVSLAWRVEADEIVLGFHVYRSEGRGAAVRLTETPLDPSATSFVDESTRGAKSYTYTLAVIKENGDEVLSAPATVAIPAPALALGQNHPNPFNPSTKIPFTLERAGRVRVRVYDVRGALVATVFDGNLGEGRHSVEWAGRDDAGRPVASGLYLYALTTDKRTMSKKMMLVK